MNKGIQQTPTLCKEAEAPKRPALSKEQASLVWQPHAGRVWRSLISPILTTKHKTAALGPFPPTLAVSPFLCSH